MIKKLLISVLILGLTATSLTLGADQRNYRAHLSGKNQVPNLVETRAQGQAIFQISEDGSQMYYKLIVANIENVFMAHIHLAAADSNGPPVVWLYPDAPFSSIPPFSFIPGRFGGVLAEGIITESNLTGPLAGGTLAQLVALFDSGLAYVNVHTNDFVDPPNTGAGDFPGGEVRGQIR